MRTHEKIRKLRKEQGWSQAELAKRLRVHLTYMNRLETAKNKPSLTLLEKITKLFGVTTDYLLNENIEHATALSLEDQTLLEKMKLIEKLEKKDQETIVNVIDAFLTKQQVWEAFHKSVGV